MKKKRKEKKIVKKIKKIKFITFNSDINKVPDTKCLSYIHLANSLYYTKPSLF